jgi:dTDP-4-dehydrorhamnose reductase
MDLAAKCFPVLVTGARGLLGSALAPRLVRSAPDPSALCLTDVQELDVTDPAAVTAMIDRVRPRTVFHLAAWTDVDGAETHALEAMRLNAEAAEIVARASAAAGAVLVHVSTDFIFDGTKSGLYLEDDPPTPVSVYGRTKLDGEVRVRTAAPESHVIARTAWLYGAGARNFIQAILNAAKRGGPLKVVTDQIGCPTWNEDLADALIALASAGARGTFHAAGTGEATRLEMAREILSAAGLEVPIEGCLTIDLPPRPARRPVRTVLSTEKLARAAGFRFPPWRDSLRTCVQRMVG